jgi:hypothetical protein
VVAWIAVWLGTGVALGGSGQFGKVLPILVVGNLIGLDADGLPGHRRLLGPAVVWAVVLAGVMIVLGESPYLGRELAVLAAGALWFVGLGPLVASHQTRGQAAGPSTGEEPGLGREGQGIWPPGSLTRVARSELSVPSLECRTPLRRDRHATHTGRCTLEGGDKAFCACLRGSGCEPRCSHPW